MIRYVVSTHPHATGANLSRVGQWGNKPFTSERAARAAAEIDANGEPFVVTAERASYPVPSPKG